MNTSSELIAQIDMQLSILMEIRSIFPTLTIEMVGKNSYFTAPYYENSGYKREIMLSSPITLAYIEKQDTIGRWVNQSFIIRLCAILERHCVIPNESDGKINQEVEGWEEVELIRRIRNKLAHKNGEYNPEDTDDRKLYEIIVERFQLNVEKPAEAKGFPIPIDTVLIPLSIGCKKYIEQILKS